MTAGLPRTLIEELVFAVRMLHAVAVAQSDWNNPLFRCEIDWTAMAEGLGAVLERAEAEGVAGSGDKNFNPRGFLR
jgi:hypothetical protein